jgi:hypothetical protein
LEGFNYKSTIINPINNFIQIMARYSSFRALSFAITLLLLTYAACNKRNIDFSDIAFSKLGSIIKHIASPAHVPSSPSQTIEADVFPAQ